MSYLAVIRPSGRARIGFFFFSLFHFDMQCFLVFCSFSVLVFFFFVFIKCRTCTRGDWTAVTWLFLTNEIRRSKCSWIGRHENWILSKTIARCSALLAVWLYILWLQVPAQPVKKSLKMAFEQHSIHHLTRYLISSFSSSLLNNSFPLPGLFCQW